MILVVSIQLKLTELQPLNVTLKLSNKIILFSVLPTKNCAKLMIVICNSTSLTNFKTGIYRKSYYLL